MTIIKSIETKNFVITLSESFDGEYFVQYMSHSKESGSVSKYADLSTALYAFAKKHTELEGN